MRLALDDFGTGYSSLSYLSRFPVDILKMDRSFLRDGASPDARGLATAVVALGATLDLEVVAEGIEFPEQWHTLRELGCELGQGFYFARPMDVDATLEFLAGAPGRARRRCSIATRGWTAPAASPAPGCSRRCATATSACCGAGCASRCSATARSSSRSRGRSTSCPNAATAMSLVGIAMTVPTIVFLLVGGVASDRFDRRRIMLAADVARARRGRAARGAVAHRRARALARRRARRLLRRRRGVLRARVRRDRARAAAGRASWRRRTRSTRSCGRSRCGWPARRSAACWSARSGRGRRSRSTPRRSSSPRRRCWRCGRPPQRPAPAGVDAAPATCARAGASCAAAPGCGRRSRAPRSPTCCSWGRSRCCCRCCVKNELGGSATDLGLVFAAGGLGSVACAVVLGRRGLPRRDITFMYVVWTLATLAVAGYGLGGRRLAADARQPRLQRARDRRARSCGRRRSSATCRPRMLGRVSSLDWLISIGLLPLSFALTGPVSAAIGVRETLVARRRRSARS